MEARSRLLASLHDWPVGSCLKWCHTFFFLFLTTERFKESILRAPIISASAAFLVHDVHFLSDFYFFRAAFRILRRVPLGFDSLALLTARLLDSSPAMKKFTVKKGKKRASVTSNEVFLQMLLASVSEVSMLKEMDNNLSKVLYLVTITSDLQYLCQEKHVWVTDLKVSARKRNKTKVGKCGGNLDGGKSGKSNIQWDGFQTRQNNCSDIKVIDYTLLIDCRPLATLFTLRIK